MPEYLLPGGYVNFDPYANDVDEDDEYCRCIEPLDDDVGVCMGCGGRIDPKRDQ